jgi:hypothetical protein
LVRRPSGHAAARSPLARTEHAAALEPLLTREFDREHVLLLELYIQAHLLLGGDDVQGAHHRLGSLMLRLRDHAARKEATLYAALTERHACDPFLTAVLHDARAMTAALVDSAGRYYGLSADPLMDGGLAEAFRAQLHSLGVDLTRSMELDASMLFPLYRKALHLERGLLAN